MTGLTSFNEGFDQQISFLGYIPVSRFMDVTNPSARKYSVQTGLNIKNCL